MILKQTLVHSSKLMGALSACALSLTLSLTTHALEVGSEAPCVVLEQIQTDGQLTEGCIRDRLAPNTQSFTVIDFSSIYCSYCEQSLPALAELTSEIADTATVRKVIIDRNRDAVLKYLEQKSDLTVYPVALDTDRDAKKAYQVTATPTLFVLNAQNQIVYKHIGLLDRNTVRDIKRAVR